MARSGSNKRQRQIVMRARLSDAEAQAVRKMAETSGMSVGEIIRRALLNTPVPYRRRPSLKHEDAVRILGQLGKIGSNINQIARHANSGRPMDRMENTLEYALRDLSELRIECLRALGCERIPDDA